MITIYFRHPVNQEVMQFKIVGKVITYSDKVWKGFQLLPRDEVFFARLSRSQQKQFAVTEADKIEYEKANTEEELSEIIKKDMRSQGCKFIGEEK